MFFFFFFFFSVILKTLSAQGEYGTTGIHKHGIIQRLGVCVCGGGGGGGGGEGGSYLWHSMDVRAEWPPFSALPSI